MPSASFCIQTGGKGSTTVSRWARATTASRNGFGMPFLFVLPSAASENIVSISDSNWSAGRISQRNTSRASPPFHHLCAWPASTTRTSPGPAVCTVPSTFAVSVPSSTSNVSVWAGCTWAAATNASGSAESSISTYSPPVCLDVVTNVIDSPVTGLYSVSPGLIMAPPVWVEARRLRDRCGEPRRPGRGVKYGAPANGGSDLRTGRPTPGGVVRLPEPRDASLPHSRAETPLRTSDRHASDPKGSHVTNAEVEQHRGPDGSLERRPLEDRGLWLARVRGRCGGDRPLRRHQAD